MNPEYIGIARESFQNGFKMFLKVWYLKKCYKTGINQDELSMGIYIIGGAMTWFMLFGELYWQFNQLLFSMVEN